MVFQEAVRNSIFNKISNYCSKQKIESLRSWRVCTRLFLERECTEFDLLVIGDGILFAKEIAKIINP